MLSIVTPDGASLVDPANFKNPEASFAISSSLECSASAWSSDNSQLYLASSSSIKRYTPSECLLEELYSGSDAVTCLEMTDSSGALFFGAANKVWLLDCTRAPGRRISSLDPHRDTITGVSISNDGTLLASLSASAVFVHELTTSSHAQLKGLPDRKVICCLFHQHSRTRLLLGVGRDLFVYDSTRPSSPLKTVRIPGDGDIAGAATSPFSKTLVAVVTSNGDVVLVDLDKDNGILKTVNVKSVLTCCAFTAEGAALYLGTECGELLVLDLRSLEKEPKSFIIGDGGAPIKAINVQRKPVKVKSNPTAPVKSSPQRAASSRRTASTSSVVTSMRAKSPTRIITASRHHGGSGVIIPKRRLFSPVRSPLSETKNVGLHAQLVASRSPTLSRRAEPLKRANRRQGTEPDSTHGTGQDVRHLGLGAAPESISGHLAAIRVRSGPVSNPSKGENDRPGTTTRRVISGTVGGTSSASAQSRASSSRAMNKQPKEQWSSATLDNGDECLDMSSPELPCEPVTPISLGKNPTNVPLASVIGTGVDILGLTSPKIARCAKGEARKGKGKEKVAGVKEARFVQHSGTQKPSEGYDQPEDEDCPEIFVDEKQELSLQVSPRRPAAPPTWLQSPHRPSPTSMNMNAAAQDFLRNIVHDVMYDFQRETKAEMTGLHLDLVRMGRGWKQELREIMEEQNKEIRELKAENKRLKEENERMRRGY